MLCSPLVLVTDLEGQLTSMAQHHHRHLCTGGVAQSHAISNEAASGQHAAVSSNRTGPASCSASPVSSIHVPACNCGCTDQTPLARWRSASHPRTCPSTGSSCCSVEMTNTAVLPMPDLAWQITSMPRMACGMHSCCTAIWQRGTKGGRHAWWAEKLGSGKLNAKPNPCHAARLGTAPHAPGYPAHSRTKQAPSRTLGGVLKAAVLDGTQQLRLEQEVLEAAAVDAHVALLHLRHAGSESAHAVKQTTATKSSSKLNSVLRLRTWAPSLAASPAVASSSASS